MGRQKRLPIFVSPFQQVSSLRLILMGTGPFAVPSFEALRASGHDIAAVVTRPAVLTANKKAPPPSPVRVWATNWLLDIHDPLSINGADVVAWLSSLDADLMVVCDYGQILSREALGTTRLGGINLHGSLLPRHRGAAPVQWSVLAGDKQAGVSIIHMTPTLDGGPVLHQNAIDILPYENSEQLEQRLSVIGVASTLESIEILKGKKSLVECESLGIIQDKSKMTKAPRLKKEDGQLNPHYSVQSLEHLVHGLQPWPGTYMNLLFPDGKELRLIVSKARAMECDVPSSYGAPGTLLYGQILKQLLESNSYGVEDSSLCLVCLNGLLALDQVQPAGKKSMEAREFIRGYTRYESIRIQAEPNTHRLLNQMQTP